MRRYTLPDSAISVWVTPIILTFGLVTTSDAYVAHPWCTSGRGWSGSFSCALDTYQQCLENARLYTANCDGQPRHRPAPANRIAHHSAEAALGDSPACSLDATGASAACNRQPLEKGKRDSHPRNKRSDSERQVILIEGNNPLHGPPPRLRMSEGQLPTPPAASLWISFEHANCAVTHTRHRNCQSVSPSRSNVSDSQSGSKYRWNFSTRELHGTRADRISQCDDRGPRESAHQGLQCAGWGEFRPVSAPLLEPRVQEFVGVAMSVEVRQHRNTYQPLGLLAELTHRCPLGCPYCSNPLHLDQRAGELDAATWARVFHEAAALGVLQVHLSGGEPGARRDLVEITAAAHAAGLYGNLITSGVGISASTLGKLVEAGLDHVQISVQDSGADSADTIAGYKGAFARKNTLANEVVRLGLLLTINVVVHRANIERIPAMVELALSLGASRVEIAHVQYYGWALENRAALMPEREQVTRAAAQVEELRRLHHGRIVIDAVVPDYYARYPKPCVGGWGRRSLNVTPSGKVLPCHAAEIIPGLEFWNVKQHALADIWENSPAFRAFRGVDWMGEPCASCPRRDIDFGGCRCQAFALTGDATATDPVCHLSPHHDVVAKLAIAGADVPYVYRRLASGRPSSTAIAEITTR